MYTEEQRLQDARKLQSLLADMAAAIEAAKWLVNYGAWRVDQGTLDGALADLRAALALEPAHLSHYQLTMEPGTVFGALPPAGLPEAG